MTDKIPVALAVLDRLTDYIDPDGHTYSFNEVARVRQVRAAFAGLLKAANTLNRESDYPIPAYFKAALAAVEELP